MKPITKGMLIGAGIVLFGPKILKGAGQLIDTYFGNTPVVKTVKKYYKKAEEQVMANVEEAEAEACDIEETK